MDVIKIRLFCYCLFTATQFIRSYWYGLFKSSTLVPYYLVFIIDVRNYGQCTLWPAAVLRWERQYDLYITIDIN